MESISSFPNFFVAESIDIAELGDEMQSVIVHELDEYGFLTWHTTFVIDLPSIEAEKD